MSTKAQTTWQSLTLIEEQIQYQLSFQRFISTLSNFTDSKESINTDLLAVEMPK